VDAAAHLQRLFGHASLRPGQREAVEAAFAQRDALVVMPTGSGKSRCYQLLRPPVTGLQPDAPAAPLDEGLATRLRDWRSVRSRNDGVPAYVVLTDACLDEVCRRLPGDERELPAVPGMGPARIERYGQDLLELVRSGLGAGVSRPPMPV
jgi:superfamily II DNA helicase RecQ